MKTLIIILSALSFSATAQVGFNNPAPDPSSILDLTANNKGLLIPRMSKTQREAISSPALGLLVFELPSMADNNNRGSFYYYNGVGWFSLNEWDRAEASTNVSLTGNASVSGNLNVTGTTTTGSISSGSGSVTNLTTSGTLTAGTISANSLSSASVSVTTLVVPSFANNALVPTGAIIMWSGSPFSLPAGWALCDGSNGTPNLRGRFIVGYDQFDSDYSFIGGTGGEKRHFLTTSEIPSHNHAIPGSNVGGFGGFGAVPGVNPGVNEGGGNTALAGGGQAHENRPPYYTLAYIMKLP